MTLLTDVLARTAPVLVFLVAITVVAEPQRPRRGVRRGVAARRPARPRPRAVAVAAAGAARRRLDGGAVARHHGRAADPGGARRRPAGSVCAPACSR
nr:hypothetical protein [Angustibacter aerolatus]